MMKPVEEQRPYVFRPFPKMIYKGEAQKIVQNEAELDAARADGWDQPTAPAPAVHDPSGWPIPLDVRTDGPVVTDAAKDEAFKEPAAPVKRGPGRPRKER
jgi:hypothetical protein